LGLLAVGEENSLAVRRGVQYLVERCRSQGGWHERHFTGTGFPRVFYLRYHGYSQYFPLWALGVYLRRYNGQATRQEETLRRSPQGLELPILGRRRALRKWCRRSGWPVGTP
jgi:squalene-hopene/tetraprenyl-beta-curcumene cyclase